MVSRRSEMNENISVVVADDHNCINRILKILLSRNGYNVVGQAVNGEEAVELVRRYTPDVIVLDLMMPKIGGIEVARTIKKDFAATRTVGFSGAGNYFAISSFLEAGGMGFVMKTEDINEVSVAIRSVLNGQSYLSSTSLKILSGGNAEAKLLQLKISSTTRREREIWVMICKGMTTHMMAAELGISSRTVEGHRRQLRDKLECRSVAKIIQMSSRAGIMMHGEPSARMFS